ncbi:MAG: type II toxin-antitoxin system PemK/MazF family toxin [Patescibacteria group bacterium]
MFEFGTIVLVPFPFTDLTSTKVRPALIVSRTSPTSPDLMLSFITSQVARKERSGIFTLRNDEDGFAETGLKVDSSFRFDKIATLSKTLILGELGYAKKAVLKKMVSAFDDAFGFTE